MTVVAFRSRAPIASHFAFEAVIDGICRMGWERLNSNEVMRVAKAYYYFSVQFRENLAIARARHSDNPKLAALWSGECETDHLSPWPGEAAGERMSYDEFMRRLLEFHPAGRDKRLTEAGLAYLDKTRRLDDAARASSVASYEAGGLSRVFNAMLRAPRWHGRGQRAFRFFLEEHIRLEGGARRAELSRRLPVDDRILPLWAAFRDLLTTAVPKLATVAAVTRRTPPRASVMPPKLHLV
jgi:hypothetical protein